MLLFKSRDHDGAEIIINQSSVRYALPTLDGNTVIYFDDKNFIVVLEKFESFKKKVLDVVSDPLVSLSGTSAAATASFSSAEDEYKDLDTYPGYLPRLPTGYVDKRTTLYKEWFAGKDKPLMHVQV